MDSINTIIATSGLKNFTNPIRLPFELPTQIYSCMISIWLLRPQLQRRFPLYKLRQIDFLRFLAWCVMYGRREYPILRELEEWDKELNMPLQLSPTKKDLKNGTFTVAMYLIGIAREEFCVTKIISSYRLRKKVHHWICNEGQKELGLATSTLLSSSSTKASVPKLGIYFSLTSHIAAFFPRSWKFMRSRLVFNLSLQKLHELAEIIPGNRNSLRYKTPLLPFGVNLFGYAKGELGIGEDVRMLAHAFNKINFPFCIVDVQPGKDVSQGDESVNQWITDKPKYFFNIFCMTGIEFTRVLCEKGLNNIHQTYNIGLWPWELPRWPQVWHHAWNGINELWGISSYTLKAYEKAPLPKFKMPLPVMLGEISDLNRKDFNLPLNAYLFIFSFDFNSKISRKNPEAVISAFQKAFTKSSEDPIGLILKVNHPRSADPKWVKIKQRISRDKRIYLIEGTLRKKDLMALYKCCDCMISLHRAEGFGRILAEAQLLGLEIITTGFSGNMDFCAENSTNLVNYNQCTLSKGEYFFAEKQVWAEPDINHAAELMYETYHRGCREKINYNTQQFDISYCGEIYKKRLTEVYEIFNGLGNNNQRSAIYSQTALI